MNKTTIFEAYAARPRRQNLKPSTLKNYNKAVEDFQAYLDSGGLDVETITEEDVEAWALLNHYAPSTRVTYFYTIASVYKYARRKNLVQNDPFVDARPPHVPVVLPQILSNEQMRHIRSRCLTPRQETLFALFAYTGLRMSEGRTLHSDQIKKTEWGLQLDIVGKGDKPRFVPVHPVLEPHLKLALERKDSKGWVFPSPRSDKPIGETFLYMELADIWPDAPKGKGFHSFRRTVASSMDRNGVSEALIEKILGWSRFSMFDKHYRNIADERLHEAIGRLYADDSEKDSLSLLMASTIL